MKNKNFDLGEAVKHMILEDGMLAYHKFMDEYNKFPSGKILTGEQYRNFMNYKRRYCYNQVRKIYPQLPEL